MGSQARMGTEDGQSGQAKRRPAPSGPYRTQAAPAGLSEHRSGRSGLTGSRAGKHRVSSLLARHRGTSLHLASSSEAQGDSPDPWVWEKKPSSALLLPLVFGFNKPKAATNPSARVSNQLLLVINCTFSPPTV